jgi:hypothetical protein
LEDTMRIVGLACVLLLGLIAWGCQSNANRGGDTVTVEGVLRGPGPTTPGVPPTEWAIDPGEDRSPVAVDISRMRDRALKLEGKPVKATLWSLTPADVESGRRTMAVKELDAR